jgi:hypothetical protein
MQFFLLIPNCFIIFTGYQDNSWFKDLFEMRNRWVPAHLSDTFWAGMTTTQRVESMNKFLNNYLRKRESLADFIENFDKGILLYAYCIKFFLLHGIKNLLFTNFQRWVVPGRGNINQIMNVGIKLLFYIVDCPWKSNFGICIRKRFSTNFKTN